MSLRAQIERALSPGLGYCYRCHRPWRVPAKQRTGPHNRRQLNRLRFWGLIGVDYHETRYKDTSACFPLCRHCWETLEPTERMPYYLQLVSEWQRQSPLEDYDETWLQIRQAVLVGR